MLRQAGPVKEGNAVLTKLKINNGALETEVNRISEAKRRSPVYGRSKGVIWSRHVASIRNTFGGREKELFSPDFLEEWQEYVEAVASGELRGYML